MSIETGDERRLKLMTRLLQRLATKGEEGVPIIVEGKKDLLALRKLGITGKILCVKNSCENFVDFLDRVQSDEVILLVDFDKGGASIAKNIIQYLEGRGVKVNSVIWRGIRSLARRDIKDVEGFPSYLEKLKKRASYS